MAEIKDESGDELEEKPSSAIELIAGETLPEEVPEKIEVDHSKLYVWIADSGNNRIQKFDGNGKFLLSFGRPGGTRPPYAEGEFKTPSDMAIDVNGNI